MTGIRSARLRGYAPFILLGIAVVAAGVKLLSLDSQLTFIADDWMLLVKRHGWSVDYFLHPFNGNLVAAQGLVYKLIRELFGMGSATPYYAVAIAFFLASAVLLFVYIRRRVGDWPALLGAILILFLGAAFEDLLFAFQVGYFAAVAAGLGALIALDREDDRGDRIACALLIVSLAFSSIGIAFVAGALADLFLGRRPRARRSFVALLPIAVYALWWVGWGHVAHSYLSAHNIASAPKYVFDAAAAGIVSLLGLATGDGSEPSQPHLVWGRILLVAGLILLGIRIVKAGKVPRGLAVALAIGLAFWGVAALNHNEARLPTSSRYQYPSAVLLLLIAAEILRGLRVPRLATIAAAAITVAAVVGGVSLLDREHEERWVPYANSLRSSLAAVEIAGPSADPDFPILFAGVEAPARAYLSAVSDFGSPAFTEAQLRGRPAAERASADLTMAMALGLALSPPDPGQRIVQCQTLRATADGHSGLTLLRGGFVLSNPGADGVEVKLSRFADEYSVGLGPLDPGVTASLQIPADQSSAPWNLGLFGDGPVRLCTTTGV